MGAFNITLKDLIDYKPSNVSRETWLGLDTFPLYDHATKTIVTSGDSHALLVQKIIDHYFTQEIGIESPSMFQFAMRRELNEIMPYFNQLYATEDIAFDPMVTVKVTTTNTGEVVRNGTSEDNEVTENDTTGTVIADSTSDNTQTVTSKSLDSDFPQSMIESDGDYADRGNEVQSENSNTGTGHSTDDTTANVSGSRNSNGTRTETDTDNSTNAVLGYTANPNELLTDRRNTILNIDMLVIGRLSNLFMLLWPGSSTDEYIPEHDATQLNINRGYWYY